MSHLVQQDTVENLQLTDSMFGGNLVMAHLVTNES